MNTNEYNCKCGKEYNTRNGLYKHKLKCKFLIEPVMKLDANYEIIIKQLEDKIKLQEREIINLISSHDKEIEALNETISTQQEFIDYVKNNNSPTVINESVYDNVVINEPVKPSKKTTTDFLNKCDDAINIDEFLNSLEIKAKNYEEVYKNGINKSISSIILEKLKSLDKDKRPFYVSDVRRKTFMVKSKQNEWVKDNDLILIKNLVYLISTTYMGNIQIWIDENKGTDIQGHKNNDKLMVIFGAVMSDITEDKEMKKVINNLVKDSSIND